jgi:phosphatidylglycerophosphate synthase
VRTSSRTPIAEIRERTYKGRDAWWTVLLVDPLASRLVYLVHPYRWITPNLISVQAFLFGLGAAACFATAEYRWMALGALLFHLSFVCDCMDGKIARLNGTGSPFGAWLDYILDRIRVMTCAAALFGAQYAVTDNYWYLVVGGGVIFIDGLHHINALEISRVRAGMRNDLAAITQRVVDAESILIAAAELTPAQPVDATPAVVTDAATADDEAPPTAAEFLDPEPDFRSHFKPYVAIRGTILANRIRPNLISTIEMHMAVFIIAPLVGSIMAITLGVNAVLIVFDVGLCLSFFLNTKVFARRRVTALRRAESAEAKVEALALAETPESVTPITQSRGGASTMLSSALKS